MLARLWSLLRRRRLERELDDELRHHIESLEADYRARGLSPQDARAAARRDFGSYARTRELYREQGGLPMLETLWRDVRFALRSMRRTPVVTLAVLATLAIGLGANTAIFSVINGVLLKPLPFPESDRLISVAFAAPGIVLSDSADVGSSLFLFFTQREQNRTLEGIGLIGWGANTLTGQGEPEQLQRLLVTSDIFPVLRVKPLLGRAFTPADDAPGAAKVLLLTYGYWQRRFGGDPAVMGKQLLLDGEAYQVIGVMPRSFSIPIGQEPDVITPYGLDRGRVTVSGFFRRSIARLKPGVTMEQAGADMARLIPVAIDSFPMAPGGTRQQLEAARLTPALRPLKDIAVGDAGNTLWVLMGTIGIVLLIACANVATLILVRTERRQQELVIRAALGAGWRRIGSELFAESVVLSLAGGALGIGSAYASLRVLLASAPANLPRADEIGIDSTVLLFSLGLSLFSALLFGTFPVLRFLRPRAAMLAAGSRRWTDGGERLRARGVLVVAQVALALVLLVSAGLMIRTFQRLNQVDTGFTGPDTLQTVQIAIPEASEPDPEKTLRREQAIQERLAAIPGVTSVAFASAVPMGGGFSADLLMAEGKVYGESNRPVGRQVRFVSPGYFGVMGIRLVAGRDLAWTDVYGRRPVALVSEELARMEWGSAQGALGKRMRGASATDQWREIIGVVAEVRDRGPMEPVSQTMYVTPIAERFFSAPVLIARGMTYVMRTPRASTPSLLEDLERAIWAVDPNLPLVNVRTMAEYLSESMARTSFTLVMLALAGGMALLLGLVGIYGVISYAVSKRTREVGIRIALGARSGQVQSIFLRQGLALTGIGMVVGLAGAAALTRWMRALLYEVSPLDPIVYVAGPLVLIAAAALASYFPARRVNRVDPIEALRAE